MALVDVLKIINADSEQKSLWQLWTAALIKSLETVFSQQAADIIRLLFGTDLIDTAHKVSG